MIIDSPRVVQRSFSELVRHRPWKPVMKILESKHVQTEPPAPPPPTSHSSSRPINHPTTRTDLPPLHQRSTIGDKKQSTVNNNYSNATDSSMYLKRQQQQQESSNFSMFKGMNSNDLYNYIDDVISQFRAKTNMMLVGDQPIDDDEENNAASLSEFSNTIFYPEDREINSRNPEDDLVNLRSVAIRGGGGSIVGVGRKFDRIALHDLSTILSSDNDEGGRQAAAVGVGKHHEEQQQDQEGYLESRSFTNNHSKESTQNDELEVEGESSTFINYTHSFEIDESDDVGDELDETLES